MESFNHVQFSTGVHRTSRSANQFLPPSDHDEKRLLEDPLVSAAVLNRERLRAGSAHSLCESHSNPHYPLGQMYPEPAGSFLCSHDHNICDPLVLVKGN